MSDFGFDANIILAGPKLALEHTENQQRQATLSQMLYNQQRERSLADITSQNPSAYSDPTAQALARGGFGPEADAAQSRSLNQQMAAEKLMQLHGDLLRSQASTIQTPEQYSQWASRLRPEMLDQYGLPDPDKYDSGSVQRFVASGMAPAQGAQYLQEQKRRADLSNPTTPEYQTTAETYRKIGLPIQDGMDLNDIPAPLQAIAEKFAATGLKVQGQQDVADTKASAASALAAKKASAKAAATVPTDPANPFAQLKPKDQEAKWKELADTVSTVKGRANLNAQLQNRLYASERVKNAALDDNGNIKNLDPTMLNEVAAGTAALLANGSAPAEHTVQQFLPKGRGMGQAGILEWLTNDPQGANQQGFIKQMVDLSRREESLITKQMQAGQLQGVPRLAGLKKLNGARFDSILRGAGLDPSALDENGLPAMATPSAPASGTTVTVRRKSDGVTKTLSAAAAAKYLQDPGFEAVK